MSTHKRILSSPRDHPPLIPAGETVAVSWLRHTDGICHAQVYYDENPRCKPKLLALANQVALKGRVTRVPENGHQLKGRYRDICELKPGDHRFFGFRRLGTFYICYAAKKDAKKQEKDYEKALGIREAFFNALSGESAK